METHNALTIDVAGADGVSVVTVRGDVDMTSAPELRTTLEGISDVERAVVDLRTVTFIDSMGLGALIAGRKALEERGITMALVADSGPAGKLLALTKLDDAFPMFPSVEEAVAG